MPQSLTILLLLDRTLLRVLLEPFLQPSGLREGLLMRLIENQDFAVLLEGELEVASLFVLGSQGGVVLDSLSLVRCQVRLEDFLELALSSVFG